MLFEQVLSLIDARIELSREIEAPSPGAANVIANAMLGIPAGVMQTRREYVPEFPLPEVEQVYRTLVVSMRPLSLDEAVSLSGLDEAAARGAIERLIVTGRVMLDVDGFKPVPVAELRRGRRAS